MKLERNYLPQEFEISDWKSIETYFEELNNRTISSVVELKIWLKNRSELDSVIQENLAWRYIKMNCNTQDKELAEHFEFFVDELEPKIATFDFELNKKLVNCKFSGDLFGKEYDLLIKLAKIEIDLFREENIPIQAELQKEEQEYGRMASEMTIEYQGQSLTLQKASNFLKEVDGNVRENVFRLIWERRLKDSSKLDDLMMKLIEKRQRIARNAGFDNYRDYMFRKLGRFDYNANDCVEFHNTVQSEIVPLVDKLREKRKKKLKLSALRPWDLDVDENLLPALKPFINAEELIQKTKSCFRQIKAEFSEFIDKMHKGDFLDLDSRFGKAPGGFNYPLHESNIPFIFMNATGNLRDLETMVHEGGHAIHSFLTANLELSSFKETPSEVAELASMSMELISMEHWDVFFEKGEDLNRAKMSLLKGVIDMMPWVAMVDKFQHELYTTESISPEKWKIMWRNIMSDFSGNIVDWTGLENIRDYTWQKQLHVFEVPFYYIEYGFAQLGAVAIWRNYKKNPAEALKKYQDALKLGYTRPIPEIYKTAGIEFNFSKTYIRELVQFVQDEIEKLSNG